MWFPNLNYSTGGPDGGVTATGWVQTAGLLAPLPSDLLFPATVLRESTEVPVTEIGIKAFAWEAITSITFPDSVVEISIDAFEGNGNLTTIIFPSTSKLREIGHGAFQGCPKLQSVELPRGLRSLGRSAFRVCTALASVTYADGVANSQLEFIDERCFEECNLTEFECPRTIRKIHDRAFRLNRKLARFEIPDDAALTWLGSGCFHKTVLKTITIPPTLEYIGSWTFMDVALEVLELSFDLPCPHLGAWMFKGSALKTINIPDAVRTIEAGAFEDSKQLEIVNLRPSSQLYRLACRVFAGTKIREMNCPACLTQFELEVFSDCPNMKKFTTPDDSQLETICKGAFQNSGIEILVLPGIKNLSDDVFAGCTHLRMCLFTTPTQTPEQRKREINLPCNLFQGMRVYVLYPEGTLKKGRRPMNAPNYEFVI
jgi:hypothetical protein